MQFTTVNIVTTVNDYMTYKDILCDANNLYKAYLASVKTSKWKESTQIFEMNFLRGIFRIRDALFNQVLTNGVISEFELHEQRGKVRPITSLSIEDRIVRHALCDEILMPKVRRKIIYDNGASSKGRGIDFQRKRFEVHLRKYYKLYGNEGWALFGDFRKFYDNVVHELAKRELLKLVDDDSFVDWLLTVIFDGFKIDVSHLTDEEYLECFEGIFDKLEYRRETKGKDLLTGQRFMPKSVNIGDQLSQTIGIYYPNRIDTYVKYVAQQKFYGRYTDDWYVFNPSKDVLLDILDNIRRIANELHIHINEKKTKIVKISSPLTFLQIKFTLRDDGKIIKRMKSSKVTLFRRKLKKLAVKVNSGEVPYIFVENMFKSWMGSFYKLMSRAQREGLISLYETLFNKRITIINKKMVISEPSE